MISPFVLLAARRRAQRRARVVRWLLVVLPLAAVAWLLQAVG